MYISGFWLWHLEIRGQDAAEAFGDSGLSRGAELQTVEMDELHFEFGQTNRLLEKIQSSVKVVTLNFQSAQNFVGKLWVRKGEIYMGHENTLEHIRTYYNVYSHNLMILIYILLIFRT